jgi:hypothetical protein
MSDPNKIQEDKPEIKTDQFDALVTDIGNNLTGRLSDLMSKLLNSVQDKLFKMSDEADNNEERSRYFELMNQLRTLKPAIADNFNNNIKEYLLPAKEFEDKQIEQKTADDELSLVDQDDMEGIVLVQSIGERADAKYHEQLSYLEARLEDLTQKSNKTFKPDALAPTNFCQAFNDALSDNFDSTNKKLLFGMFDAEVANKLDVIYDSINNRLIDADILPQIKLHAQQQKSQRPRKPPQVKTRGADAQTGEQIGSQTGGNNISGFAMTAAPGGNFRHTNQNPPLSQLTGENTKDDLATSQGGTTSDSAGIAGGAISDYAGNHNTSADNTEYQHYTAGIPASQVGRVLGNYIGTPFNPDTTNESSENPGEYFPESTQQHFGHQEVIQALSSIQNLPQFDQQEKPHFDGEAIKQAVLEAMAKTSGGAVTKRINQIAEKTIDFIELIFDAIIDDGDISDTVKTLLLRLQIPIIKASMSDQQFFIYDDHPARVLLDTIADTGVGVNEHTDNIYMYLDKIVNNILGEYDLSTEIFQSALDDLNTFITEQEEITSAIEEEEQKQLLRKHARTTVLKSLRAITTGKTLPEAVHPLILKRWPTLMFNHYLKNGKENNEWTNIVLTLRYIVDSVQPITSAEHLAKTISDKDDLFEQTEQYLNISSNSKKDVQNIMTVYAETVQQHIDDANFTEEEVSIAETTIRNTEPVEEAPIEEIIDKPSIPANIMPGMWFQLFMGENKTARRCKLSVILVEDANLMFINHKGELVVEKSFDDFNKEVANNSTRMIMGHSAFENAFKTVINRLN